MGNSTLRKSGVTGSSVPGCSTGWGGTGMSALMLYQALGSWLSSNKYLCCSLMGVSFNGVAVAGILAQTQLVSIGGRIQPENQVAQAQSIRGRAPLSNGGAPRCGA